MTRETLHETAAKLAWYALIEFKADNKDAQLYSRGRRWGYQRALNALGIYHEMKIRDGQIMVEISDGSMIESASVLINGMPQ